MAEESTTLLQLFSAHPGDKTAVVLPEAKIQLSYSCLRHQAEALAQALAAMGVQRGDRVGLALPNGLPSLVGVLAASLVATAAPLNPAYREDEFRFYLED